MHPANILLPLFSAMLYAVGALLVKRSSDLGVGIWRTTFVSNIVTALVFQPLWLLGGTFHAELLWQPALVALCYLTGQWLTLFSLDRGDVSVATPVLGLKIILVAFFVTLLGSEEVPPKFWFAAVLATAAVALLGRRGGARHHHVGVTILTAGLSAVAFALFDVLVRRWAPTWGAGCFLPVMMGMVSVCAFVFVPLFREPLSAVSRPAWPWLLGGTVALAVQSAVFVSTLAVFGNVTAANVVYSSRGLWSVVAVWLVGHWFVNREQQLGAGVLRWRLAGAALMMGAIALVLV